jgi:hypothetical protein
MFDKRVDVVVRYVFVLQIDNQTSMTETTRGTCLPFLSAMISCHCACKTFRARQYEYQSSRHLQ